MLIKVKVFPNSKKEELVLKEEDRFEIKIKEKPIQGMANQRILEILAEYLNTSIDKIRIIKGLKRRNKIIEVMF